MSGFHQCHHFQRFCFAFSNPSTKLPAIIICSFHNHHHRLYGEIKGCNGQRKESRIRSQFLSSSRNIKTLNGHKQGANDVILEDEIVHKEENHKRHVYGHSFLSRTFVGLALMFTTMIFDPNVSFSQDVRDVYLEGPQLTAVEQRITTSTRPTALTKTRYWDIIRTGSMDEVQYANERLMEHAVGVINTMFYDSSGGARFTIKDMHDRWKVLKVYAREGVDGIKELKSVSVTSKTSSSSSSSGSGNTIPFMGRLRDERDEFLPQAFLVNGDTLELQKQHMSSSGNAPTFVVPSHAFDNRDNAEHALKWLVSTLDDPYSKYLTREELEAELKVKDDGFLGLGAIVEVPLKIPDQEQTPLLMKKSLLLSNTRVANLPRVTAIVPDSPAERSGIVVGDRIAAIGSDKFIGLGREEISKRLAIYKGAENYVGYPELTVAKPVIASLGGAIDRLSANANGDDLSMPIVNGVDRVLGYKLSRVRLPTTSVQPFSLADKMNLVVFPSTARNVDEQKSGEMRIAPPSSAAATVTETKQILSGGDSIVHWVLLTPETSIFEKYSSDSLSSDKKIGYIRLTRFSRLATIGYTKAVEELEKAGAQSYIIDVRNNYGGVIQESMLTASTLLRDVNAVLCYTLNSRGGFTPHDVEEYILDEKFPGYFLSNEPKSLTLDQVKRGKASNDRTGLVFFPNIVLRPTHRHHSHYITTLSTLYPPLNCVEKKMGNGYLPLHMPLSTNKGCRKTTEDQR
jgi:Periplasmic protease